MRCCFAEGLGGCIWLPKKAVQMGDARRPLGAARDKLMLWLLTVAVALLSVANWLLT